MSHQDVTPGPAGSTLSERYGGPSRTGRRLVLLGVGVLVVAFLGWLVWVIWLSSDPKVTSQLTSFSVRDDHEVSVRLEVDLSDPSVRPACELQALAEDHSVVGQTTVRPTTSGQQTVTLRTDRRATSVESLGCTAPGQDRPR